MGGVVRAAGPADIPAAAGTLAVGILVAGVALPPGHRATLGSRQCAARGVLPPRGHFTHGAADMDPRCHDIDRGRPRRARRCPLERRLAATLRVDEAGCVAV